jgi:hypothetical protein
MDTLFITSKFIGSKSLESRPEEDLGFDYDEYGNFDILGDNPYDKSEAGVVDIVQLMTILSEMKAKGANYVGCDWHCDHQELDLYGFNIITSTSDEIKAKIDALKHKEQKSKEKEFAELEKRLEILKKDLENPK